MNTKVLFLLFCSIHLLGQDTTEMKIMEIKKMWETISAKEEVIYAASWEERLDLIYELVSAVEVGVYVELSQGKEEDGRYHIILSANGNKKIFDSVKLIVDSCPELKRFRVTAFRQKSADYKGITYGQLNLQVAEMYFEPIHLEDGGLGLFIYIPKQKKGVTASQIHNYGSIVMDNVIGEYEFATKIRAYDILQLNKKGIDKSKIRPLKELSEYLDSLE